MIVATKAGYEAWDRPPDFSAAAITASAEASLRRLGSDFIDLLQLHNAPTAALQAADVREALAKLVASGKIRAWGASTKSPAEAIDALRTADVGVVQANFNMMDVRALSDGLFDEVVKRQAGFIGRTPLCFGFLAGTIRRDTVFPPRRSSQRLVARPAGQLDRRCGRPAGRRVGAARAGGCAERLALLSFVSRGLQRHSRHPDAARRPRTPWPARPARSAAAGGRGGAGDQPPPPVLRQATSKA